MKWYKLLLLSLVSGLLFGFAWYPHGFPFLIFFSFIPLFFISDVLLRKGKRNQFGRGLLYAYPAFLVWNCITTYWIGYSTIAGVFGAILLNSLIMALVFAVWHGCKKQNIPGFLVPILFIALWMSYEYLHLHWDLTWPWLCLGNVFAVSPRYVQWYSVTGVFGGDLWILVCNFLLYRLVLTFTGDKSKAKAVLYACLAFLWLFLPIMCSFILYKRAERRIDKTKPVQTIIVQQNTDPWEEEYVLTNEEQTQRLLKVAAPYLDTRTDLVVCPESCIPHNISLQALLAHRYPAGNSDYAGFTLLDNTLSQYPNLNFILGLSTFQIFDHKASETAQQIGGHYFIDLYNTVGFYNRNQCVGYYHKSRLVPGVEKMPFPKIFGFLENAIIKLGGSNSSLGTDTCRRVFTTTVDGGRLKVGTVICYESIYGELFGRFVKNGANVMTVITNDSWWNDSPGHIQHFEMSRLRAIETRCYLLRAANGGFSGIIDPLGNVLQKTKYNERTAIRQTVFAQNRQTFYVKHGDYLARIAVALTTIGLIWVMIAWFIGVTRRFKKNRHKIANKPLKK